MLLEPLSTVFMTSFGVVGFLELFLGQLCERFVLILSELLELFRVIKFIFHFGVLSQIVQILSVDALSVVIHCGIVISLELSVLSLINDTLLSLICCFIND